MSVIGSMVKRPLTKNVVITASTWRTVVYSVFFIEGSFFEQVVSLLHFNYEESLSKTGSHSNRC